MRSRVGTGVLAVALAAGLGLGLVGPPARAASAEANGEAKKGCKYAGEDYSHGATIILQEGSVKRKYECKDGEWVYIGIVTVPNPNAGLGAARTLPAGELPPGDAAGAARVP
jgi:hypothetical protein